MAGINRKHVNLRMRLVNEGQKALRAFCLLGVCSSCVATLHAQYKADHIPGFTGLENGTQAPPGIYLGDLLWVYPTGTIKDNNGDKVNGSGSLTSTIDGIVVSAVTNHKVFGANYGAQVVLPFIKNEIQLNSLNVSSSMAFSDMIVNPVSLGWHLKRADVTAGYNLYLPTGTFSATGTGNTGLGMYGNEITLGSTVHLDAKRHWNVAATYSVEFNSSKKDEDVTVGTVGTLEGGLGRTFYKKVAGPIPLITNLGVVGYAQSKLTNDSGSGIPLVLSGYKDRIFALGPEANVYVPGPRLTFLFRYEPEFEARNRAQGQTFLFSIAWVAKSLSKHP